MLIIGDVHDKVGKYLSLIAKKDPAYSYQVGDMGYKKSYDTLMDYPLDVMRHQVIMGNHDFYPYVDHPISMGDYDIFEREGNVVGFCRGAATINQRSMYRVSASAWIDRKKRWEEWENYNDLCFPLDEELTSREFEDFADASVFRRQNIMLSHDCPQEVCKHLFGIGETSTTRKGLQKVFEAHQPDVWIFGHHHRSKTEVINGTKFICLKELESVNI